MAWTVAFSTDTNAKGIGTITATYTDPDTSAVLATYTRRVDTNSTKDVSDFSAEAKATLEKQVAQETEAAAYLAKVFAELIKS